MQEPQNEKNKNWIPIDHVPKTSLQTLNLSPPYHLISFQGINGLHPISLTLHKLHKRIQRFHTNISNAIMHHHTKFQEIIFTVFLWA